MPSTSPDWELFKTFLAVLREGSLSAAARALESTQPTMGRQVAALEQLLGVTLFIRGADGLTPTEAALRLLPSMEAMAAAAKTALRAASSTADEAQGTVRITASHIVGNEVLPAILADLQAAYPRIAVELALSNRNQDLLRGDADIAVRMARPAQNALIAKKIGQLEIGLYAHRRYLARRGTPQRMADLPGHALIGYDCEDSYARVLEKKTGIKFSRDMFAFRSDSDVAQLAALRAGLGIGVCQRGIAGRDDNLLPVLHGEVTVTLDIWLAMHRDLRSNRRIRLVFDELARQLTAYAGNSGVPAPHSPTA